MKTIIAGSRRIYNDGALALAMLDVPWPVTTVISGAARGVDRMGESWARTRGVRVEQVFAEWGRMGHRAGIVRNVDMARRADALVALWDGHSPGTRHMICTMLELGKPVRAFILNPAGRLLKIL